MTKPYALIQSGTVQAVVIWDGVAEWIPPDGMTEVDISTINPQPGPGWAYSNGVFTPPAAQPIPVPQSVSRFQALAALHNAGLLDAAQAAVTAAGGLPLLAWNNAQSFERGSPTIASLAAALNLTPAQLDALFIAASQIEA